MKKNKLLVGILSLFIFSLSACDLLPKMNDNGNNNHTNNNSQTPTQDDSDIPVEEIVLSSTELTIYAGDVFSLGATVLPSNATNKKIAWKSSNPAIASVSNGMITALNQGVATITASAVNGVASTCRVDVLPVVVPDDAISKYGVNHLGTLEDPLENGDAYQIGMRASVTGTTTEYFYIKGIIDSFYHAPATRADGAVSWFFRSQPSDLGRFEVYRCYRQDGSPLTNDDVWVGQEVIVYSQIGYYAKGNQPETNNPVFITDTGNGTTKPSANEAQVVTFNEMLEIGHALNINETAPGYYRFQAYLKRVEWHNYIFTNSMSDDLVPIMSPTSETFAYYENSYELYQYTGEVADQLTIGSLVELTVDIKNYYGQLENSLVPFSVNILSQGPGVLEEPPIFTDYSFDDVFLSLLGNSQYIFELECRITSIPSTRGSFNVTDPYNQSGTYLIEKSSPDNNRLRWIAGKGYYDYEDNIDFKNSEMCQSLQVGDIVKMWIIRSGNNLAARKGIGIILDKLVVD